MAQAKPIHHFHCKKEKCLLPLQTNIPLLMLELGDNDHNYII